MGKDRWYVIHTKPRQESRAEHNLLAQGYDVYLPMLKTSKRRNSKWVEVVEPLFPRYAFIRLTVNEDNFSPIRSTLGVSKMVKFGDSPAFAPDGLVKSLKEAENPEGGAHLESAQLFKPGSTVNIVEGPLQGINGIVQCDKGDERVILLLNLLGRENSATLPRNSLIPG